MKFFVVLYCCVIASNALDKEFTDKFISQMKKAGEECISEVKASEDDIDSLLSQKIPESHEGKCMIFCMHRKFNAQKEDGSFDLNGAIASWEPLKKVDGEVYEKVVKTIKTCENTATDPDPCVFASSLAECAIREGKNAGLDKFLLE